jgi:hypothetical protein
MIEPISRRLARVDPREQCEHCGLGLIETHRLRLLASDLDDLRDRTARL